MNKTEDIGILFPEILIPSKKTNKKKWSVIACDQYTSNQDYWNKTAKIVGSAPSTLHIMVPEIYLHEEDVADRIEHVKETMINYVENGALVRLPKGFILTERETPFGTRTGIILAIDLDKYDADHKTKPLIRATEQTVLERIPPRMKIREGAALESPHVMLMLNDSTDSVIGELYSERANFTKIYDTPLMQDGGHIKGWFIDDTDVMDSVVDSLKKLKQKSEDGMLFAVGDGNHTLASAKAVWDQHKESLPESEWENSPLKYALVEIVNLYDHGISMHPIHRVLFNVESSNFLRKLVTELNLMGLEARMMYTRGANVQNLKRSQNIFFESRQSKGRIEISSPKHKLVTIALTMALDKLLDTMPKAKIDYVHGDEEFSQLTNDYSTLGFRMESMTKDQLFDFVSEYGVLPRKAFSLGEAQEKRYYYECRLLVETEDEEEQQDIQEDEQETSEQPIAKEQDEHEQPSDIEQDEPQIKESRIFRKRRKK